MEMPLVKVPLETRLGDEGTAGCPGSPSGLEDKDLEAKAVLSPAEGFPLCNRHHTELAQSRWCSPELLLTFKTQQSIAYLTSTK